MTRYLTNGCCADGLSACAAWRGDEPSIRLAEIDKTTGSLDAATSLLDQGKVVEAVTAFRKLLREHGPSLKLLNGLAIAYGELGRRDLAVDTFAKALAIAPDDPATYNNIGFAALRRREVVKQILDRRGDALVVAGLGAAAWDVTAAGDSPLTFPLWGAMGGAVSIGLGLALAQKLYRDAQEALR